MQTIPARQHFRNTDHRKSFDKHHGDVGKLFKPGIQTYQAESIFDIMIPLTVLFHSH